MSSKIYYTQDDSEIVDYLSDAAIKFDDYSTNKIFSFFINNNYHLVLYFADGDGKGFVMFRIDSVKDNINEVTNLRVMLQSALQSGNNIQILKEAIAQVRAMEIGGLASKIFKA